MSDPLEQLEQELDHDAIAQALADATVHVVCAQQDLSRVQAAVDQLPASHLYRVRATPFVQPGVALAWQVDGLLMPSVPTVLRLG